MSFCLTVIQREWGKSPKSWCSHSGTRKDLVSATSPVVSSCPQPTSARPGRMQSAGGRHSQSEGIKRDSVFLPPSSSCTCYFLHVYCYFSMPVVCLTDLPHCRTEQLIIMHQIWFLLNKTDSHTLDKMSLTEGLKLVLKLILIKSTFCCIFLLFYSQSLLSQVTWMFLPLCSMIIKLLYKTAY